jgi:hypothetical protein
MVLGGLLGVTMPKRRGGRPKEVIYVGGQPHIWARPPGPWRPGDSSFRRPRPNEETALVRNNYWRRGRGGRRWRLAACYSTTNCKGCGQRRYVHRRKRLMLQISGRKAGGGWWVRSRPSTLLVDDLPGGAFFQAAEPAITCECPKAPPRRAKGSQPATAVGAFR